MSTKEGCLFVYWPRILCIDSFIEYSSLMDFGTLGNNRSIFI